MNDSIICSSCGVENKISEKQWRITCRKCGMAITLPKAKQKQKIKTPGCFTCMDKGLVFYKAQEDGKIYDFVAKCTCSAAASAGVDYPAITEVGNVGSASRVENDNRLAWEKVYGKAPVAMMETLEYIDKSAPF